MELTHTFTVPVGVEQAFAVLRDIQRVAPCMPGAALDSVSGDEFTGTVKVKVGPMQITYRGEARFVDVDEAAKTAAIEAKGTQIRGAGTASALVRATLQEQGADSTLVTVQTELNVTGKPAQFGRGVMADVGNKLLGQFADCLAGELQKGDAVPEPEPAQDATAAPAPPAATQTDQEAIDLFQVAGAPVLKRVLPLLAAALLLIVLVRRRRGSRRRP